VAEVKVLLRTGKSVSQSVFEKTFVQLAGLADGSFEDVERLFYRLEMYGNNPKQYRLHTAALFSSGYDFIAPDGSLTDEQVEIVLACFQTKKGKAVFSDPTSK
jgi:hypothetical protein